MRREDILSDGTYFRYTDTPSGYVYVTAHASANSRVHKTGLVVHTSTKQTAAMSEEVELLDADTLLPLPDQADTLKPVEATLRPSGPLDNGLERVGEISPNLWNRSSTIASSDPTNPEHYNALSIEPIDAIESWGLGYNLGNVVAYIARAGRKPGHPGPTISGGVSKGASGGREIQGDARARDSRVSSPAGDAEGLREAGRRSDLRKALRYLIREITGLDGTPSWDYAAICDLAGPIPSGGRDA